MRYYSTRSSKGAGFTFKQAVMMGMAEDGGLLLPELFPLIGAEALRGKSYTETAFEIIRHFADDIAEDELRDLIEKSYATFETGEVVPLRKLSGAYLGELYYGPTYAFKDVALQFLGNVFEYILAKEGGELNIIGATSGDTGSAAIYGVKGKRRIKIAILFPKGRVSEVQRLQMTTVPDENVHTIEVAGTFDDCQRIVKMLFADLKLKKALSFGAVNSINWARVLAQIVYYFYLWGKMPQKDVTFVVPTGNFGNILAGYCAKRMGLPIKLVLATNSNDILHRFISNADYSVNKVVPTASPAMDIQLASNFERYLYYLYGEDATKLAKAMQELQTSGRIHFSDEDIAFARADFVSCASSDEDIRATIKAVYERDAFIVDPHTACGLNAAKVLSCDPESTVCLATAHPAKFGDVVKEALGFSPEEPAGLKAVHGLTSRSMDAAANVDEIKQILIKLFGDN